MKKLCMTLALAVMLALPASAARVRFGVSIGGPVYYGPYPTYYYPYGYNAYGYPYGYVYYGHGHYGHYEHHGRYHRR